LEQAATSGRPFDLSDTVPRVYLYHHSELGQFFLSSDSVIPTYTRRLRHITEFFSEEENARFQSISYTIGGMMVFPGNRIDGKYTINVARGFNSRSRIVWISPSNASGGTIWAKTVRSEMSLADIVSSSRCSTTLEGT